MRSATPRAPTGRRSLRTLALPALSFLLLQVACGGGGTPAPVTPPNPTPVLTSLSPDSATAGGPSFTLTVNGSGFITASVVRWNGANRTTTFVSSSQLSANIPFSDIIVAGTAQVTVFNPTPGGGTSNALSFTINNPVPTLTYIFPPTVSPGIGGFNLQLEGSGFVSTSIARWNGADRVTSFISPSLLLASIPASDVENPGTAEVTVFSPSPGGGTSNPWTLLIEEGNPVPNLNNLVPSRATAGDPEFTLRARGSNFVPNSVVRWNGEDRPTTFVNSGELNAAISASDVTSPGTAEITVFTPRPGGGRSRSLTFAIESTNPVPLITGIRPLQRTAGAPDFTLEVTGARFVLSSVVRWNGANRPTTFFNDSRLQAAIPASDIANPGTADITVFNPPPGGGTSNALTFIIPSLSVATSRLPDTTGGKNYDFRLAFSGGTGTFTWGVVAGTLPPDLTLNSLSGRISGTVTPVISDTSFNFTVQVSDSTGVSATRDLSILVRTADLGRNDTCTAGTTAGTTRISNGRLPASLSPYGDVDVYSFEGTAGAKVTIQTFAQQLGVGPFGRVSNADTVVELLDSDCNQLTFNDDMEPGIIVDSLIADFELPASGIFFIRVRDFRGDGRPDLIYELRLAGAN